MRTLSNEEWLREYVFSAIPLCKGGIPHSRCYYACNDGTFWTKYSPEKIMDITNPMLDQNANPRHLSMVCQQITETEIAVLKLKGEIL